MLEITCGVVLILIVISYLIGYEIGYEKAVKDQERKELEMENVILKEVLEDELF